MNNNQQKPKVRVIGAGPSGLMSLRHLSETSVELKCYEANNQFGGNWSEIDLDNKFFDEMYQKNYGTTYQSVYEDLQTNVPKLLLVLKDFPPKKEQKTYWSYQEYQNYLIDYGEHFGLKKFIQFNTIVENVFWIPQMTQEDKDQYQITSQNKERFLLQLRVKTAEGNSSQTQIVYDLADFVFVCNGRFSVPYYPPFERSQEYDGTLLHSHSFRKRLLPNLANKKILVIGLYASGYDLLQFLIKNNKTPPKEVHLAIRNKKFYDGFLKTSYFREELETKKCFLHNKSIKATGKNKTIIFDDGSKLEDVDEVIFCTGYQMSYPFLDKNLIEYLGTDKKAFGPLYKRTFCINEPHLIFIGVQSRFVTYYEKATMVATAYVTGKISLPNKEIMMKDYESDIDEMKKADPTLMNYLYNFGNLDDSFYKYDNDLAKMLNFNLEDLDLKQSQYVKNFINAACGKLLTGDFPQLIQSAYKDFQIPFNHEEVYCNTKF